MSETNDPVVETSIETENSIDYKSLYEKAQVDIQAIVAKKDQLLDETKKAKAARDAADHAANKAAEDKAQKDGEFEKLWKTAKDRETELTQKLANIEKANRDEKVQISAMRIAAELADGDNIELLSDFVQRNLDKMANDQGALSADVIEAVKDEFKNNSKYRSLLRASKAQGGGAVGNTNAKTTSQDLSRAEFDTLGHNARKKFFASGGKLKD